MDGEEPLRRIAQLQEQLDGLTAAMVGRARYRRITWATVSNIMGISEDTARHRYVLRRIARFNRSETAPTSLAALFTPHFRLRSPATGLPALGVGMTTSPCRVHGLGGGVTSSGGTDRPLLQPELHRKTPRPRAVGRSGPRTQSVEVKGGRLRGERLCRASAE
ncbi:hypothetical protein SAMN06272735_9025 [Streptomyces sp. TLI_55]|nr:hypothetical protein SAMN06272735_9025 [Streptomyces sp. TLI_55]